MKKLFFLLLFSCFLAAMAQYPINSVTVTMPTTTPASTDAWGQTVPPFMILAQAQMRNGQLPPEVQECRILVTIKQGGSKKFGSFTKETAPSAGFSNAVRNWSGANAVALLGNSFTLPAGQYELCVEFFSMNSPVKSLSNEICKTFTVQDSKEQTFTAPQNIMPTNKKILSEIEAKAPLTFRWIPLIPKPSWPVTYRLKVWQLMQGQNGTQAMRSNQPFVEEEIKDQTLFLYRKGWLGWPKNASAIWIVEALDQQGKQIGISEPTSFTFQDQQQENCCKGGSWGNKTIEGIPQVRCDITLPNALPCSSTKNLNFSYSCNSGAQCNAQINYKITDPSGVIVSSVTAMSGINQMVMIPAISGFYCLTAYAICNGVICDSCKICFKVECDPQPQNCCTGSSWISKSIDWPDVKDKMESTGAKTETQEPSSKKIGLSANGGVIGQMSRSITINKCDSNYHLGQGGSYTFNANFQCAPGANCTKKLFVRIKGIGNTFYDGIFSMPKAITFNNPGSYTITYLAVCGTDTCARCPFVLTIDQNCCIGSKWNKAEYQIVNLNSDGSWDRTNTTLYNLLTGGVPTLKADLGFTIQNLTYQCANQSGCVATYIIKRKNMLTGAAVIPDETLPLGQNSTSIYSKPFPQLITIIPLCGRQNCGNAIMFKVECLTQNCIPPPLPRCTSCDTAKNLVINGDFESGNTAFFSDFVYDEYDAHPESYKVNTSSHFPNFLSTPPNKFIKLGCSYINHNTAITGKTLWKNASAIPTIIGKKYSLCLKIINYWTSSTTWSNPLSSVGYPDIKFDIYINGVIAIPNLQIGSGGVILNTITETSPYTTKYNNTQWQNFNTVWNATSSNATIEVKFKNVSYPNVSGWAFGLDDIVFKECSDAVIPIGTGNASANIDLLYPKSPCPIIENRPTFQWANKSKSVTSSAKYQLKVVEITKADEGIENIDQMKPIIFLDNISSDNVPLPKNNPSLEPNKFYAWQVSKIENEKLEKSHIELFSVQGRNNTLNSITNDCCQGGLIANGGFVTSTVTGTLGSGGSSGNWSKGYGNPTVNFSSGTGCFDDGYIKMNGNLISGSCIQQVLSATNKIKKGKRYKVSMAVKFEQAGNTLNYARIRVVAFNGSLGAGINHRLPNTDLAIIGRSTKITECDDWSVRVFTIWTANKDFENIAVNVFTDDNTSSSISIDNISLCEIETTDCDALSFDKNGDPITPVGLQKITDASSCAASDEDEDYFNGSLSGLYGYDGTFSMYNNLNLDDCNNIEGPMPPEFTNYNCDDSLKALGIDISCDSLQRFIDSPLPPFFDSVFIPTPLTALIDECSPNMAGQKGDVEKMDFGGRDIIYIHGLQFSHIIDKIKGKSGATESWPLNKSEFLEGGYYKTVAEENWANHIKYYETNRGRKNRYFIASYNCAERADVSVYNLMLQIKSAMEYGTDVVNPDEKDPRKKSCFGREFIIISHSTGGLIANLVLSIANQTKTNLAVKAEYGDAGFISDRCKGHISFHGAMGGSNLAKIAVLTGLPIMTKSVLLDLTPEYTYGRWSADLKLVPKPVLTISGGHPMLDITAVGAFGAATLLTLVGAPPMFITLAGLAAQKILPGLDDMIVNMESSAGRDKPHYLPISKFITPYPNKAFDLGIKLDRALASYYDQKAGLGKFSSAANPYLTPSGMVEPRFSSQITNPQFPNNYTFIQSASEHIQPKDYSYFDYMNYKNSLIGSAYSEEQLVTNSSYLYTSGIVNPSIINEMVENIKGKKIVFTWGKFVWKNGRLKFIKYNIERYIWKRLYHNLQGNRYDYHFAYDYLFKM